MGDQTRFLFYVLFFIYLIITIFCVFRLWRIHSFAKESFLAKVFYVSLFVQNCSSSLALLLLAIFMPNAKDDSNEPDPPDEEGEKQLIFVLTLIPDIVFLFSYLILFW